MRTLPLRPAPILLILALGARAAAAPDDPPVVTVYAAASAADVVDRIGAGADGVRLCVVPGPSSTLARQILDGAPADVFVSASPRWVDELRAAGAVRESATVARNRLWVVAPAGSALAAEDLVELVAQLAPDARVAIADEGVPAGEYAREALASAGAAAALAPHLVGFADVRAVLRAVADGQVAAGFVYATDAREAGVRPLFALPAAGHAPIELAAALLQGATAPAAAFFAGLQEPPAQDVFRDAGFEVGETQRPGAGAMLRVAAPEDALGGVVRLSLLVALLAVAAELLPALLIGWWLARARTAWRAAVHAAVMLPLVLPPVVTGYLLLEGLGRQSLLGRAWHAVTGGHLSYTTTACVVAAAVVGFPLLVEAVRLSMLGVDPRLEGVSRTLGRGRLQTFLRVTLPLGLPGLVGGAVLAFARALGEFGATIVLAGNIPGETRQIPVAVYTLLNQPGGGARVAALVGVSVGLSLAALLVTFAVGWRRRAEAGR